MRNVSNTRTTPIGVACTLIALISLAACASDVPESDSDGDIESSGFTLERGKASAAATPEDEGVPGEVEVDKAGCTHIQWCNEPGSVGTVCIWDSCSFSAAVSECTRDARAVCGGITQPAEIR